MGVSRERPRQKCTSRKCTYSICTRSLPLPPPTPLRVRLSLHSFSYYPLRLSLSLSLRHIPVLLFHSLFSTHFFTFSLVCIRAYVCALPRLLLGFFVLFFFLFLPFPFLPPFVFSSALPSNFFFSYVCSSKFARVFI